jgi:signal transduction histidine kinase
VLVGAGSTEADQAKGGAGLGLTITRHIIEAQGGRIWAESQVGAGTSFCFTLPRARPRPRDPEALADERAASVIS